ncbi:carboxylesterase/lipase family protein [Hylemonella gracilis]|uniref:Carboxylic ester hydrolase n=2 Tax=Hylemonella gracilis TaxID=80880 RepID=A0A4P6UQC4_9BURK|nr:carboxylesterase/lipase family protein [Hylemonella gracilis]
MLTQGCAHQADTATVTQRSTSVGSVLGVDQSASEGLYSWKGVPYAQPPVGALRWKAPADPQAWASVRRTQAFGPACVQTGRLYGPGLNNRYDATIGDTLGKTVGSEDCLYLNIWQPSKPSSPSGAPRPVIVWVYGGSNITGYTGDPVYDGGTLAKTADAVVVSVNYRLGIFGFLNLAPLKTGDVADDSGNFALLDIVKALEFVQRNIASFGGDPRQVTLMGESAGAVNIYALLTSPTVAARSTPLFHRLIALSGGISTAASMPAGSIAVVQPYALWAERGNALLVESLISDGTAADEAAAKAWIATRSPQQLAAYLRGKSADALLTTVRTRLAPRGMAAANVMPDGAIVASDPIAAIKAGRYVKVPVLAGNTRDEGKLFPSFFALRPSLGGVSGRLLDDAAVFSLAHRYQPDQSPTTTVEQWIPQPYLPVDTPKTGFNARSEELSRIWFMALRDDVLNALKSQQAGVWHYRFDWDELPAPFNDIYGAAHAFDLPFVFGNFGPSLYANISFTKANEPGRLALSNAMMRSVGMFARQGDPNDASLGLTWPRWPSSLRFDATPTDKRITAQ